METVRKISHHADNNIMKNRKILLVGLSWKNAHIYDMAICKIRNNNS